MYELRDMCFFERERESIKSTKTWKWHKNEHDCSKTHIIGLEIAEDVYF